MAALRRSLGSTDQNPVDLVSSADTARTGVPTHEYLMKLNWRNNKMLKLGRIRKKQPAAVRIVLHAMKPEPAESKYDGHMELEDKKKLFGLKPEPQKVKEFLDDEDCMELSRFMDAVACTLRELCQERNLDYRAAAKPVFSDADAGAGTVG